MSAEVIPAILPRSFKDLEEHLGRIRGISRKVQVDIYEGGFWGRGRTWPLRGGNLGAMIKNNETLPYWTEFDTEFDLMVSNAREMALQLVGLHAARIVVHAAFKGSVEAAEALASFDDDDHPFPVGIGVAVTINDPLEILQPFEHIMDFIQVMGIAKVGAQGRSFDERALQTITRLRHRYPQMAIQVDGGVSLKNTRALIAAGATRLVEGSAIFGAKDAGEAYKALYTEANGV
jgi:ribulose-phosphate 3-epimerase